MKFVSKRVLAWAKLYIRCENRGISYIYIWICYKIYIYRYANESILQHAELTDQLPFKVILPKGGLSYLVDFYLDNVVHHIFD